ncbi:hypothetical protein EMIT0158MI4_30347 [Burkholderia ambifaria]
MVTMEMMLPKGNNQVNTLGKVFG